MGPTDPGTHYPQDQKSQVSHTGEITVGWDKPSRQWRQEMAGAAPQGHLWDEACAQEAQGVGMLTPRLPP